MLTLKNIFLSLITLGIYISFAKTQSRKFLWNNTKSDGNYLSYTGTGGELLKGYAIAFLAGGNMLIKVFATTAPVAAAIIALIYVGMLGYDSEELYVEKND